MIDTFSYIIFALYAVAVCGIMLYGLNCYVMIFLFRRSRKNAEKELNALLNNFGDPMLRSDLPKITTQIPVFNELNVIEQILKAACAMRYPNSRHEIQVLDDSTDETRGEIDLLANELRAQGHNINVVRRKKRIGYKAGALAEGLQTAEGDLFAIFDADFAPPSDFLLRTVPFFMLEDRLGLVQARWGHLNRNRSILTQAQSIGIDGHFMVEQSARNYNGLYMNFNGTAGMWRRQAILEGGGWQWDTLTEDMDLSYRVQFAGWTARYLKDLVVPAEIPEDVNAFKSQQFRWAKGSIQTARKLIPSLIQTPGSRFKKIQAILHLTHYLVHPMMLSLAALALPVLLGIEMSIGPVVFTFIAMSLGISMMAPSSLYLVSQKSIYPDWRRRIFLLPFLIIIGVGVSVSNTRAVLEALAGRDSAFIRTPKRGQKEVKRYRIRVSWVTLFEIVLGIYCSVSLGYYLAAGKYLVGPFLALYASGFLFIGLLTLMHALRWPK